uniref:Uncharacterized protein n=1 Tax=Ciona savignyi TaxID=51511 RepID=H2ZL47_CIOSA
MTSSTEGRARDKRRSRKIKESEVDTMVQRDNDTAQEKTSTTDELLALFEQVNTVDDVNRERKVSPVQPVLEDRVKSPVEEVVDKTINEMSMDDPKQRTSQQLIDNVISNVATHNENTIHQQGYEQSQEDIKESSEKKKSKEKRLGSSLRMSHKSYRTPPVGYSGVGVNDGAEKP